MGLSSIAIAPRQAEVQSVSPNAELRPNVGNNQWDTQRAGSKLTVK
jgi:hypothetical protein